MNYTKKKIEKLLKEASDRGFVIGATFKDLHTYHTREIIDGVFWQDDSYDLRNEKDWGACIYHGGNWAELITNH